MVRALIDIGELDQRLHHELGLLAPLHDFSLTLWRHEADESGCNWNAQFKRFQGLSSIDLRWHEVVPRLRRVLNLA